MKVCQLNWLSESKGNVLIIQNAPFQSVKRYSSPQIQIFSLLWCVQTKRDENVLCNKITSKVNDKMQMTTRDWSNIIITMIIIITNCGPAKTVRPPGKFWKYVSALHSIALIDPSSVSGSEHCKRCFLVIWPTDLTRHQFRLFLRDGIMMLLFRRLSDPFLAVRSQRNHFVWGWYWRGFALIFICFTRTSRSN